MQKEIEQYAQEIAERRKALFGMKRDFTILQFSMTPAEKAHRKAEVCLLAQVSHSLPRHTSS